MPVVLAVDVSNLRNFMGGDGIYVLSVVAACFVLKFWKDGAFGKMLISLTFYAIAASLMKGSALLSALSWFLSLFGINTGF
ncbi:TPA: hypothetical protein VCH52_001712 [Streptococcus pyogenes]|nr:hypothetical protein [Streptococcus pyogenes]